MNSKPFRRLYFLLQIVALVFAAGTLLTTFLYGERPQIITSLQQKLCILSYQLFNSKCSALHTHSLQRSSQESNSLHKVLSKAALQTETMRTPQQHETYSGGGAFRTGGGLSTEPHF